MGEEIKKILVIDDDPVIRSLYLAALENPQYEVSVANDGREGFRKATTDDYDLILSDLKMPNWDGVDAIRGILLVKPGVKFVVISGYAESSQADEIREIPEVIEVMSKPVDIDHLNDVVSAI